MSPFSKENSCRATCRAAFEGTWYYCTSITCAVAVEAMHVITCIRKKVVTHDDAANRMGRVG